MKEKLTRMVTVRVTASNLKFLERLCMERDVGMSALLREIVARYTQQLEEGSTQE